MKKKHNKRATTRKKKRGSKVLKFQRKNLSLFLWPKHQTARRKEREEVQITKAVDFIADDNILGAVISFNLCTFYLTSGDVFIHYHPYIDDYVYDISSTKYSKNPIVHGEERVCFTFITIFSMFYFIPVIHKNFNRKWIDTPAIYI